VELYAVISDAEHICLVMEYCRGGDLFKELARGGGELEEAWVSAQARPLPPARARARVAQRPARLPALRAILLPACNPWPPDRHHIGFEHTVGSEHAEHGRSGHHPNLTLLRNKPRARSPPATAGLCSGQMMAPLLRVLAALHARHILHRDIKPENIFLTHALAFKLGDMVRAGPIPAPARCILAAGPRQPGRFVGPRWLHGRAWGLAMALEHGKPERSMCDG